MPGAAEAVQQSGRDRRERDRPLAAESLQALRARRQSEAVILWNTQDLGYLTVQVADALASGRLKAGATSFQSGRVGKVGDPRGPG